MHKNLFPVKFKFSFKPASIAGFLSFSLRSHSKIVTILFFLVFTSCTTAIIQSARRPLDRNDAGVIYSLPKALLKITCISMDIVSVDPSTGNYSTEHSLLGYSLDASLGPNPQERYTLSPILSTSADDFLQIKVTNGLLQSVALTNTDQSLGILSNLVETVVGALQAAYSPAKAAGTLTTTNYVTNTFLLNPFIDAAKDYPIVHPSPNFPDFAINFSAFAEDAKSYSSRIASLQKAGSATIRPDDAVYYHPLDQYVVTFLWKDAVINQGAIFAPNLAVIGSLTAKRAAFVKQSVSYEFAQGILTSVTVNKPSQAAAISGLPVVALKALTGIPTNLFQFKINLGGGASTTASATGATNGTASVQQIQTNSYQINITSNTLQALPTGQPAAHGP